MASKEYTGPGVMTPGGPARIIGKRRSSQGGWVYDTRQQDGTIRIVHETQVIFPSSGTHAKAA